MWLLIPTFCFRSSWSSSSFSLDFVFSVPSAQEAQNLLCCSICIKQVLAEKSWSPSLGCPSLTPALEYPLICFLLSQSALLKVFFMHSSHSTSQKLSYLCIYILVCYLSSHKGALSLSATTVIQWLDLYLMYSIHTYRLNGPMALNHCKPLQIKCYIASPTIFACRAIKQKCRIWVNSLSHIF